MAAPLPACLTFVILFMTQNFEAWIFFAKVCMNLAQNCHAKKRRKSNLAHFVVEMVYFVFVISSYCIWDGTFNILDMAIPYSLLFSGSCGGGCGSCGDKYEVQAAVF